MSTRPVIAAAALALLVGCAGGTSQSSRTSGPAPQSSPHTLASIAGDYRLVAVDGKAIPFAQPSRARDAADAWPVVAGKLVLRPDGTFLMETTYDTNADGARSFAFKGSCFGAGDAFSMVWDGGGQTPLTIRGDTVVISKQNTRFSYLR